MLTLKELKEGWKDRSHEEAFSEVERELQVRERCFPRWVAEGRVSKVEAKDRLQRMMKARFLLSPGPDVPSAQDEPEDGSEVPM